MVLSIVVHNISGLFCESQYKKSPSSNCCTHECKPVPGACSYLKILERTRLQIPPPTPTRSWNSTVHTQPSSTPAEPQVKVETKTKTFKIPKQKCDSKLFSEPEEEMEDIDNSRIYSPSHFRNKNFTNSVKKWDNKSEQTRD